MKSLMARPETMYRQAGVQDERVAVRDPEPMRWQSPALVRCACSACGTHAYRRLGPDGGGPLDLTGVSATCRVCGASALAALEQPVPAPGA